MKRTIVLSLLFGGFACIADTPSEPCKDAAGKQVTCPLTLSREETLELTTLKQRDQVLQLQVQLATQQLSADAGDFANRVLTSHDRKDMTLDMRQWSFVVKPETPDAKK